MDLGVLPPSCRITRAEKYFYFVALSGCCKRLKNSPCEPGFCSAPLEAGKHSAAWRRFVPS